MSTHGPDDDDDGTRYTDSGKEMFPDLDEDGNNGSAYGGKDTYHDENGEHYEEDGTHIPGW